MGSIKVTAGETKIMTPALWVCRLPEVAHMVERGLDCRAFRMGEWLDCRPSSGRRTWAVRWAWRLPFA